MIGQTLLHYRIDAAIGAGGMGKVYRATDTNLGREVAIKVLPPEVAQDEARLARFRREAHLLAALNHPHLAAIHGLEQAEGQPFLVLELVEGEGLEGRIRREVVPVDEAVEIATQIAEALEAAHEKGIIHRDLKPANVKLSRDGQVKVLDFGLAKAWADDSTSAASPDLSQSPTLANTGTEAGVILGTAAYMSPEQASGKAVDKRSDIWSFGVVLFEMLTGRRLFIGDTSTEILASVIKDDPPWDALPADCPPALRKLLRRCLQRRSRERLHDIADARLELEELRSGVTQEAEGVKAGDGVAAPALRQRLIRERWVWGVVSFIAVGVAVALATITSTRGTEAPPVVHMVIDSPEGVSVGVASGFTSLPAVSPDGRHVTFVGRPRGGVPQLWVRPLDAPEVQVLPGTENASFPFWSPDGDEIGFVAEGELKKLTLDGGRVERICSIPGLDFGGGTWSGEGIIAFASGYPGPSTLFTVAAAGGEAQPLTTMDEARGEWGHRLPWFLPDGRQVLFVVYSAQRENEGLYVVSVDDPDRRRRLLGEAAHAVYATGHLVFVRDRTLFAQPFNTGRLEMSGQAVRVVGNVETWWGGRLGLFGVSRDGILAYLVHADRPMVQLTWLDRAGQPAGSLGEPGRYFQIAMSPDGQRVATELRDSSGRTDLWVIDVSRGVASRVTSDPRGESDPVWSPDSRELLFAMHTDGGPDLFRVGLQGGAKATPVLETPGEKWPEDWSRHGDTIFYYFGGAFWALSLSGDAPPEKLVETGSGQDESRLSPDGRWLAYTSDFSGEWEVYVEPFHRSGERVRVSTEGGGQPKWRQDGRELFFVSRRNMLTAVEIHERADGLDVGLPTELFEVPLVMRPQLDDYAVSPDGQRFLVKVPTGDDAGGRVHVVTNWPSLLE